MSKITAYSSLATVAVDDLLVIVDVHDTTMAGTGTDKNITAGNLLALAVNAAGPAAKTGNYTLVLADVAAGANQIDYNSTNAGTFTIPPHSSVAFPLGASFASRQLAGGVLTIAGGAGVTVNAGNAGGTSTAGIGKMIMVVQDPNTTDTWWVD